MRLTFALTFVLPCALLPSGGRAFVAPTSGVVRARVQELRALSFDEQRSQLRRPRVSILDTLDAVALRIPQPVLDGFQLTNLALVLLVIWGVDVPISVQDAGLAFTALSFFLSVYKFTLEPPPATAEALVRAKLKTVYDPPPSNPWTGNINVQEVETFVENNPLRKTLVLVDPSGTAKPDLVDPLFRGQIHVVAPVMTALSLETDLGKFFGVKDQGLDTLANLFKKGITFKYGGNFLPAKLIVNLASVDDDTKLRSVIREVDLLKQAAGDNIITIITVTNGAFVQALPQVTQSALQVLS